MASSPLPALEWARRAGTALRTEINNKINTPPRLSALSRRLLSYWLSSLFRVTLPLDPSLSPRAHLHLRPALCPLRRGPQRSDPQQATPTPAPQPRQAPQAPVSGGHEGGGPGSPWRSHLVLQSVQPGWSRPLPVQVPWPPAPLRWRCPRGLCAAGGRVGCRTCEARAPAASWGGWACSPACRGRGRGGGAP